ncbi:DUF2490 domain-containing protein [Hymenobacter persicinus]|uniref:DUF2490 domain-containing protein n=1 Tax=Hymenobacter persicinus TaxID=2025506 RepID=A0A4V1ZB92_9BACT|nr:DUF2490 domain-containing protein [Hymenobacter persicinus]RYU84273.1 DUF2490 domain-containing protein [Hymenobacter persicinus]
MPGFPRFLLPVSVLLGTLLPRLAAAQQPADRRGTLPVENVWLLYSTEARVVGKWGLHADAQIRRARSLTTLRQNQVRVGVSYYAAPQAIFTAGYSYVDLYSADDAPAAIHAPENRLYEQLLLKDLEGLVRVDHRYRLEQRRLVRPGETRAVHLNRFRYQLHLTLPLHGPKVEPGTPYLSLADEVLLNFGRHVIGGVFDQNRASVALGYQLTKATALEAGYLNLWVPAGGPAGQRHIAQLSVAFNPDLRPVAGVSAP